MSTLYRDGVSYRYYLGKLNDTLLEGLGHVKNTDFGGVETR